MEVFLKAGCLDDLSAVDFLYFPLNKPLQQISFVRHLETLPLHVRLHE